MKLGRFGNGESGDSETVLAADQDLVAKMKVGDRCRIQGPTRLGCVMFIGKTLPSGMHACCPKAVMLSAAAQAYALVVFYCCHHACNVSGGELLTNAWWYCTAEGISADTA